MPTLNRTINQELISRQRLNWLIASVFLLSLIISGKLFQKSVLQHNQYLALAKNQYFIQKDLPANRGQILAHDADTVGEYFPMATNIEQFSVNLIPKNIGNPNEVAQKLAPILEIDKNEIFSKINNKKPYIPPIKKEVNKDTVEKIKELNLDGIFFTPGEKRYYPEGTLASQLLGFVDSEGEGKYGLEGYYNSELEGHGGSIIAEKDIYGRVISKEGGENPTNGSDLYLTIDRNVQFYAENKLAESIQKYQADSGTVIIVRPKTGAILAMASWPTYDSNKYNEVTKDQSSVFLNPAVSLVWEPGSIFKPVAVASVLNEGKIEPDTTGDFSNFIVVNGYEINTAQNKSFGHETMTQCLENSDNVCLVWMTEKIGNETYFNYINKFGFGIKTGIDLEGETTGYLLPLKDWRDINRATMSFGQGISATPLQMLDAISVVANGGKLMKPYIVERINKSDGTEILIEPKEASEVFSLDTANKLTGMMVSVVENGHGKKAKVPGYSVAGKTGTAQVPNPEGGYYEDRHIGSFAGFFPADNPEFAMLVKLDQPKNVDWAESSAAPTFGDIAQWLLNYYQIPPNR